MNLYDLLRNLILSSARTGGMTKKQATESMQLLYKLQKLNVFGTTGLVRGNENEHTEDL